MLISTLFLLLPILPVALGLGHSGLALQARSRAAHRSVISKRQGFSGKATFYDVGLGACGGYNVESDFIVALNTPQFGSGYPGPNCERALRISYGGKTATAVVRDQCPGCAYGSLDMSRSLFSFFEDQSRGTFEMTWTWADSHDPPPPPPAPSSTAAPTHSPSPDPPPPPPSSSSTTTSTSTATSTTSSSTSSASVPPSSSSTSSRTTSSSTAAPTSSSSTAATSSTVSSTRSFTSVGDTIASSSGAPASAPSGPAGGAAELEGNLLLFNQAVANLGRVVVVGAQL